MQALALFVVLLCYRSVADIVTVGPQLENFHVGNVSQSYRISFIKPYMYYFHVESDIKHRYATTLISTKIGNQAWRAQEVFFTAVLPNTAFISGFTMEVGGKVYKAYVEEKKRAQTIYNNAVLQGQTAAQVALTARDSNRFTVSVNIEPHKEVIFRLTYEELLNRRLNMYRNVINLDPGQIVNDFSVIVRIEESRRIRSLKVPALKVNDLITTSNTNNGLAGIDFPTPTTAVVSFKPSPNQQRNYAANGIKGQFVVEYDVDRTSNAGEVLVNDGYFVHFFAPENLEPLRKHVTFVLDLSGSMGGRPIEQLREAMLTILDDLNNGDFFSIVLFSNSAQIWDPTIRDAEMNQRMSLVRSYNSAQQPPVPAPSVIVRVTRKNVKKAKDFINTLRVSGGTNIYDALMLALNIGKLREWKLLMRPKPESIIIFLTDGMPNVRVSSTDTIVSEVTNANNKKFSIFSLAFGSGADFNFLKKLSLKNSGFARRIYEAADAAMQLTDFYLEISSPLLADVEFEYTNDQIEGGTVTTSNFRRLFAGSEIVVAGKLRSNVQTNLTGDVTAISSNGTVIYTLDLTIRPYPYPNPIDFPQVKRSPSNMERLWAYLTIQQLLDEDSASDNQNSPQKRRALQLALQYSFVTDVTSLVVVKPSGIGPVFWEDASKPTASGVGVPVSNGVGTLSQRLTSFDSFKPNPPYHVASFQEAKESPPVGLCLKGLNDIAWLPSNRTINDGDDVLQVAGTDETNMAYSLCTTPTGQSGYCRHLQYCVLNTFTNNRDDFLPYLCHINRYVGVCCPDIPIPDCYGTYM